MGKAEQTKTAELASGPLAIVIIIDISSSFLLPVLPLGPDLLPESCDAFPWALADQSGRQVTDASRGVGNAARYGPKPANAGTGTDRDTAWALRWPRKCSQCRLRR
jgi:hypothetical protein